ncbi:MAG: type IX secretion system sortase PorU [Bacteroidota bacterium]
MTGSITHLKNKLILAAGLLVMTFPLMSQDRNARTILWTAALRFEQAIYPNDTDSLPVYSERLPWTGRTDEQPEIVLKDARFEPVTGDPEWLRQLSRKVTNTELTVRTSLQIERKKYFARFSLVPLRKNPTTGQIERLVSFVPDLQKVAGVAEILKTGKITHQYTSRSVLADGRWYKIQVSQSGIQKLTYADLKKIGFQDPGNVRVFGNGGRQLPYSSGLERPDDLLENQVYFEKGSDDLFNEGDYLLFYGQGSTTWKYDATQKLFAHRLHLYSDYSYYFLTEDLGPGRRVKALPASGLVPQSTVTEYDAYDFREKDSLNLIKSGRLWCWKYFNDNAPTCGFDFSFPGQVAAEPVKVTTSLWARSPKTSPNSVFYIKNGDTRFEAVGLAGVYTTNSEALYASSAISNSKFTPGTESFRINFQFINSNPSGEGWLDYLTLNTRCTNKLSDGQLAFRDTRETGIGKVVRFRIADATSANLIWDITDITNIVQITAQESGSGLEFIAAADQLKEYLVFDPASASLYKPTFTGEGLGLLTNQNLHGMACPDMIILVHDDLKSYAQQLADLHSEKEGLSTILVSPIQIYNEFSSGMTDVTAIRDFLKMFYDRSTGGSFRLKYFLFFGDGSYDNKNILKDFKTCLPTYQSLESLYPTSSYVTDDFFGLLDTGEDLEPGLLDIGIGRLPVISETEASNVIDKVKQYYSSAALGDWRNLVCFIGDDEDGNSHMRDANTLADKLSTEYPAFNIDKIFLDAYQQVSLPAGDRYPEVNQAISDRMKKGALIMNYLGHGSEKGLAHEEILRNDDIKNWENPDHFPLFITATCEFSRFDDTTLVSAGEWVLLNPKGGGIALLSTTRLVYSSPNFILNREFYNYAFKRDDQGNRLALGDVMRLTKNAVGEEQNKLNFTLIGDPALILSYPEMGIRMTEINGQEVSAFTDTLKALSTTTVKGHVIDLQGNKIENFNGIVIPAIYDKEITQTNLANDGGAIMEFSVRNNILFKGKASVKNGDFFFSFPVPRDIAYNVGTGKFSFYGKNDFTDAHGVDQSILIGGSEGTSTNDQTGPEVGVFMNDTTFISGGITGKNPTLVIRIKDSSGVNTTGNGIGHDITATIDNKQQSSIVLNDYYESDLDEYRSGSIRYPLSNLEAGNHTIKVKVWDIVNNSTETQIDFTVHSSDELILEHVLNYPNPFTTKTDFYFEHNQGDQALDVLIQVFTLSGKLVKSFEFLTVDQTQVQPGSFRVGPVSWDGLDDYGDRIGRGTYFYRVKVRTADGKTKEVFQKLVILK